MRSAGLTSLELQVDAANKWVASTQGIRVLNVESLFSNSINVSGTVSNMSANGVRVWYSVESA